MNRAERRARDQWGGKPPKDPLESAAEMTGALSNSFGEFARVMNAVAVQIAGNGGPTPAQAEALGRWALPAASAFRRATADMTRLSGQLAGIGSLEGHE